MEYRQLGRAGVRVSPLCLGLMNLGGPTAPDEGVRLICAALDAGVNFVDTANVYQQGRSEEIVGKALAGRRDEVVVSTKVFNAVGEGPNDRGTSRLAIPREVERSLRRLGTDHVDLYQLHRYDDTAPLDETLRALDDLMRAGKVRYVGVSTWPAWRLAQAQGLCERLNLVPLTSEQPPFNLLERDVERELLPACREFGMAVLPCSPLAGGLLTDRFVGATANDSRIGAQFDLESSQWAAARRAVDALARAAVDAIIEPATSVWLGAAMAECRSRS